MTLIATRSGCKVGWSIFDNADEAARCSADASEQRERMFKQGYDFGYQWPGAVTHHEDHPEHGECWEVVTP